MDATASASSRAMGVTETAPVLAMNQADGKTPRGTVGRLSPLMEYRPRPVPWLEEGGRLRFAAGPNVMLGLSARWKFRVWMEPLPDGGHDTGDIVSKSERHGFIAIKGRRQALRQIAGRNGSSLSGGRGPWSRDVAAGHVGSAGLHH